MKRFMLAVALTCAISATALAGNIPITDGATPQPSSITTTVILVILSLVH